jgi:tetratricopeptide (TPR) repeat protein
MLVPMTTPRRPALAYLVLFALALGVRLVYLAQAHSVPTLQVPLGDAHSYFEWSARIAAGEWWRGRVFYQAPLYPYFLALVRLTGGVPIAHILVAQAILGSLACVLLALAGTRLLDRRTGLVAGFLLALYAPAIFYDGLIQKTVLDTVLLSALLACLATAQQGPRPGRWLGAGLLLGLFCLTRENALLLVPVLPAWLLWRFRDRALDQRLAWIGWSALGLVLALAPVTFRNYAIGHELVVTTYQLGPNLYMGNNPAAGGHYVPLRPGREDPAFEATDAIELAEAARGKHLSMREVSDYWVGRALGFVRDDPWRWLALTGRKLLLLLNATEIMDVEEFETHARASFVLRALGWLLNFGTLLPLAAAGLWLTRREGERLRLLQVVLITLFAGMLPFFVFGRYRFPLVPPLAVLAAAALVAVADGVRTRKFSTLAPAAGLAAAAAVIAWLPLVSRTNQEAAASVNEGAAAAKLGRFEDALALEDHAIRLAPGLVQAHYQRAATLARMGRVDEALREYERVLELDPANEIALVDLTRLATAQGRSSDSEAAVRRAVASGAASPRHYELLAHLLIARGAHADVPALLDSARAAARTNGPLYFNVARELRLAGDLPGAIAVLETGAAAYPADPDVLNALAWYLVTAPEGASRSSTRALALASEAVRLTGGRWAYARDTEAAALAAAGQFTRAVDAATAALALAREQRDSTLAAEIEGRLALYRAGKPYVER